MLDTISVVDARTTGFLVVAVGIAIVAVGLLIAAGLLSWVGRLPGDVNIDRGNVRIFVPVTSMILASIVLTTILFLIRRWFE